MAERFSKHTVLAIIHKLESAVEDFDAIALLDAGRLREFGPPQELLQRGPEVSAFAALYESMTMKEEDSSDEEKESEVKSE